MQTLSDVVRDVAKKEGLSRDGRKEGPFRGLMSRWRRRESGIELLRILAMLMIVGHHCATHASIQLDILPPSAFRFFMLMQIPFGKIGVALFFMISAWFLCEAEDPKLRQSLRRIWNLEREVLFYSISIFILCSLLDVQSSLTNETVVFSSLFPIASGNWWYLTAYVMFLLLYPFPTIGFKKIGYKRHGIICLIFLVAWGLIYGMTGLGNMNFSNYSFVYFVYLYILISFYRWYMKPLSTKAAMLFCGVGTLFVVLNVAIRDYVPMDLGFIENVDHNRLFLCSEGKAPIVLVSFGLLILFSRWNFCSTFINAVSSATFGVYLIHEHFSLRDYLWSDELYPFSKLIVSDHAILSCIAIIVLIFIGCIVIDIVRQICFVICVDRKADMLFDMLCNDISSSSRIRRIKKRFVDKYLRENVDEPDDNEN